MYDQASCCWVGPVKQVIGNSGTGHLVMDIRLHISILGLAAGRHNLPSARLQNVGAFSYLCLVGIVKFHKAHDTLGE